MLQHDQYSVLFPPHGWASPCLFTADRRLSCLSPAPLFKLVNVIKVQDFVETTGMVGIPLQDIPLHPRIRRGLSGEETIQIKPDQ